MVAVRVETLTAHYLYGPGGTQGGEWRTWATSAAQSQVAACSPPPAGMGQETAVGWASPPQAAAAVLRGWA